MSLWAREYFLSFNLALCFAPTHAHQLMTPVKLSGEMNHYRWHLRYISGNIPASETHSLLARGKRHFILQISLCHWSDHFSGSSLKAVKFLPSTKKTDRLSTSDNFFAWDALSIKFIQLFPEYCSIIMTIFFAPVFLQDETSWEVPQSSLHTESNSIGNF